MRPNRSTVTFRKVKNYMGFPEDLVYSSISDSTLHKVILDFCIRNYLEVQKLKLGEGKCKIVVQCEKLAVQKLIVEMLSKLGDVIEDIRY